MASSPSRSSHLQDPLSDAEALAAAQQVAQPHSSSTTSASEANSASSPEADTLSNEQMVWEMLYNPAYSLSTSEAEAAWHRALGKATDEPEAVRAAANEPSAKMLLQP